MLGLVEEEMQRKIEGHKLNAIRSNLRAAGGRNEEKKDQTGKA